MLGRHEADEMYTPCALLDRAALKVSKRALFAMTTYLHGQAVRSGRVKPVKHITDLLLGLKHYITQTCLSSALALCSAFHRVASNLGRFVTSFNEKLRNIQSKTLASINDDESIAIAFSKVDLKSSHVYAVSSVKGQYMRNSNVCEK